MFLRVCCLVCPLASAVRVSLSTRSKASAFSGTTCTRVLKMESVSRSSCPSLWCFLMQFYTGHWLGTLRMYFQVIMFFPPTLVNVRLELEKYLCCKMQFFWSQTFVKCCYLYSNYITGEYGIPKPWYFPFTSLYWCGPTKKTSDDPDLLKDTEGQGG